MIIIITSLFLLLSPSICEELLRENMAAYLYGLILDIAPDILICLYKISPHINVLWAP